MPLLLVSTIQGKGRCVFAGEKINSGNAVDTNHVLLFAREYVDHCSSPFGDYPLAWDDTHHALVLGPISLVNHSGEPNTYTEREKTHLLLRLVALRDIEAGEEITYDYKVPLWFEPEPPGRLNLKEIENGASN